MQIPDWSCSKGGQPFQYCPLRQSSSAQALSVATRETWLMQVNGFCSHSRASERPLRSAQAGRFVESWADVPLIVCV